MPEPTTLNFLRHIWPSDGFYCVSIPAKTDEGKSYYKHRLFETIGSAVEFSQNKLNINCFMCIGTLDDQKGVWNEKRNKFEKKCQKNIKYIRTFILDIDAGENKPYKSKKEALEAFIKFQTRTALPKPTIVDSGGGLHIYFTLKEDIDRDKWKSATLKLRTIVEHFNLEVDHSRTTDCSSLLRVVGTNNLKESVARPVKVIYWGEHNDFETLDKLFDNIIDVENIKTFKKAESPSYVKDIFGNINNVQTYSTSNGNLVINKCAQMAHCLSVGGYVSEPYWRACLSISNLFETPINHELSDKHPEYSYQATEDKVAGVDGPYKCETFDTINPGVCETCRYWGKITSPINLGYQEKELDAPKKPELSEEDLTDTVEKKETINVFGETFELPKPPYPFVRTENGVYMRTDSSEDGLGEDTKVYQYDIYPFEIIADKTGEGVFVTKIMIKLPFGQDKIITVSFGTFADPRSFNKLFADYGVLTVDGEQATLLLWYMKSYINEIQRIVKPLSNYVQLGWAEDEKIFILPDKSILENGETEDCGVSKSIKNSVEGFGKKGSFEEWLKVINVYARPGYEHYAFGHLIGYASILFRFTEYEGAIVNLVGESGSGKSTVLQTINSIFGHPKQLFILPQDTFLAKMDRLGVYNSICVTYDEITNIDPEELSDLCYSVTQGRGRHRLNQNAELKENNTKWQLLLALSSNMNLMGKLSSLKHDASAESLRMFEYRIDNNDTMTTEEARETFLPLYDNYGHAGEKFIRYVIQNKEKVKSLILNVRTKFDKVADVPINERYWSSIVACAVAGGIIARKLGLCEFDMERIFNWSVNQIRCMRSIVKDNVKDPRSLLVEFLNQHIANTIVIGGGEKDKTSFVREEPRASLLVRNEIDRGLAFVSRNAIRSWLIKGGSDYNFVKSSLLESQILLDDARKMTLSKGSNVTKTGQLDTWLIDLNHVSMQGHTLTPVETKLVNTDGLKLISEVLT